jgi:hypothetical protein
MEHQRRLPLLLLSRNSHPHCGLAHCRTRRSCRPTSRSFHKAALAGGGRDNGEPGLRPDYGPNYYAAFVVDPDGYRIEAWCGKQS